MSNDNLLNQSEIEDLLNQKDVPIPPDGGGGGAPMGNSGDAGGPAADVPPSQESDSAAAAKPASVGGTDAPDSAGDQDDHAGQDDAGISQQDIDSLLKQAQDAIASIDAPESDSLPPGAASFQLPRFSSHSATAEAASLELLHEVELDLKIELGRTHMYLEDVLKLRQGSVVPLDKLAGDPVDVYVNGRLIARGEVLVLNDNFCVRVAELIAGVEGGQ